MVVSKYMQGGSLFVVEEGEGLMRPALVHFLQQAIKLPSRRCHRCCCVLLPGLQQAGAC